MARLAKNCLTLLLAGLWLIFGLWAKGAAEEAGSPEGKRVVMVIASRDFRDEEFEIPKRILEKEGIGVTVASSSLEAAGGMLGLEVSPDILIGAIKAADYSGIIFVGGAGAAEYWHDPVAHKIAREFAEAEKLVAAICIAPVTLANAGVLAGKRATVWPSEQGRLEGQSAIYTESQIEVDGLIVTASGPEAAEGFAWAILDIISHKR